MMNLEKWNLAVVGGGPSGLFAAITAAREWHRQNLQPRICVFDRNEQPARKILVSGNGRCNLSNTSVSGSDYPGCDGGLFRSVYEQFDNEALFAFFDKNGLFLKTDAAGRVYPLSGQAASVYDLLLFLCRSLQIQIIGDTEIRTIEKKGDCFLLNGRFLAERVVFACGSCAAPRNGGMDSLPLLRQLSVKTLPFTPALVPIKIKGFSKHQLKGVRAEGEISVYTGGRCIASDRGELQYTDYGFSGIPTMQVSGAAVKAAQSGKTVMIQIDHLPDVDKAALEERLLSAVQLHPDIPVKVLLSGMVPGRLADYFLKISEIFRQETLNRLSRNQLRLLTESIKRQAYLFDSVCGFAEAQAANGGVPACELAPETLELKKAPGVFVCGETVDMTGLCGGYNLQWAWSSGYVAGLHAARRNHLDPGK